MLSPKTSQGAQLTQFLMLYVILLPLLTLPQWSWHSNSSSTPSTDLVSPAVTNVAQPIQDIELKGMLASYEELSNKLRQYMVIPTPEPVLPTPPLTTSLNHSNTPHSSSQSVQPHMQNMRR